MLVHLLTCDLHFQVVRPNHRGNNAEEDDFVMRAPGALHHARFMASALYILKIAMLVNVLPPRFMTKNMQTKIERMAQYIAIFHGPWFLQSCLAPPAPRLDLQLWQDMCHYEVKIH